MEYASLSLLTPIMNCEVGIDKQTPHEMVIGPHGNDYLHCNDVVDSILGKRTIEENWNGCMENVHVPKGKKPKPSAVRDFPPGCGRYASRTAVHPPNVANISSENGNFVICHENAHNILSQSVIIPTHNVNVVSSVAISIPPKPDCSLQTKINSFKNTTFTFRKLPRKPASAPRDFPFGCGRNASPTTKEECLRAAAIDALTQAESFHSNKLIEACRQQPFSKLNNYLTSKEIVEDGTRLEAKCLQSYRPLEDNKDQFLASVCPLGKCIVVKQEDCGTILEKEKLQTRESLKESYYSSRPQVKLKNSQGCKVGPKTVSLNELSKKTEKETCPRRQSVFLTETPKVKGLAPPQLIYNATENVAPLKVVATTNKQAFKVGVTSKKLSPPRCVVTATNVSPQKAWPIIMPMVDDPATRSRVRETLRLFQVLCRKILQEEEAHTKDPALVGTRLRVDLKASKLLKDNKMYVNIGKQIVGMVPGIEIGDQFHYRIELCIVGLHRQVQAGIDFLKQGNMHVATSIVASGGYEDDVDNGDVLIYTGQGGNNYCGDRRQSEHQKLERGNLALKNSIDQKVPVRVIRGIKQKNSGTQGNKESAKNKVAIIYTYDGLYDVEKYWQERGASGYAVFKFQLRRQPGQPQLDLKTVVFAGRTKKYTIPEGLLVEDISAGQETKRICVVNTIDDESGPPPFVYTTKVLYPSWCQPTPLKGCDCTDGCSDPTKCFCIMKNGGEFPFNYNGAIVRDKPIVYECGPSCSCPPSCHNRVSQHGIRFNLEIFKTDKRGWGVRSSDSIPSGSFVCEYTGELLSDMEAEQRVGSDEYLFDIGSNSKDQSLWSGLSGLIHEDQSRSICDIVEDVGFTIDAAKYGSVGRFVNHSCSPNLYAQNVLYDHDDKQLPHIMLFAAENIPPMRELFYHYNYTVDQVYDSSGNIKKKYCYCGSSECTGRMY